MNNEEQIEGNKLIALFMGYSEDEIQAEEWCGCNVLAECAFTGEKSMVAAAYDSSWSWLMPVVEKIEAMPDVDEVRIEMHQIVIDAMMVSGDKKYYKITYYSNNGRYYVSKDAPIVTKIEAVWSAVIAFIKWHQTQTT